MGLLPIIMLVVLPPRAATRVAPQQKPGYFPSGLHSPRTCRPTLVAASQNREGKACSELSLWFYLCCG